jgi:hypothetical protein
MSDEPSERLILIITRDLWDAIERQAKTEQRHITAMARLLVERGLMDTARRAARLKAEGKPMLPVYRRFDLDKPRKRPR